MRRPVREGGEKVRGKEREEESEGKGRISGGRGREEGSEGREGREGEGQWSFNKAHTSL